MKLELAMYRPATQVRKQRGVATLEFAICVPFLLLLMLATAELGRAIYQYNTLLKAVRDGARYLATNASTNSAHVVNINTARRVEACNLIITGNTAGTGAPLLPGMIADDIHTSIELNRFISVSARYTYSPMLGASLPSFGFGDPIDLSRELSATIVVRALP